MTFQMHSLYLYLYSSSLILNRSIHSSASHINFVGNTQLCSVQHNFGACKVVKHSLLETNPNTWRRATRRHTDRPTLFYSMQAHSRIHSPLLPRRPVSRRRRLWKTSNCRNVCARSVSALVHTVHTTSRCRASARLLPCASAPYITFCPGPPVSGARTVSVVGCPCELALVLSLHRHRVVFAYRAREGVVRRVCGDDDDDVDGGRWR